TEGCTEFLRDRSDDRPLCLVAGFVMPHCPFICPPDDWDYYLDRVTLPDVPDGYHESLHPAMRRWREGRRVVDLTDDEIRRARAGYYGLVTHLDRMVGELLDTLNESGLADNTIVIYTSDHGEMAGEHGMWWKSSFYEGSASVPLIVSAPGRFAEGARMANITNLIDLGPTMADLAGADPIPGVDGRSLAPVLRGEATEWLDETFSEHYPSQGLPPTRMIRSGPWKLTHFEGERPQLFNLDDDPDEWSDLGEDPAHADVRERLQARVLEGWSGEHMEQTLAARQQGNRLLTQWYQRLRPEEPEQWVADAEDNVYPEARIP
ncbi:MAG: sulfatase-like hydrolase/transferase, partial [Candidatus Brocadiia bacterium]|nr:sulfatase-like hydrolase/transferase [Candidatus Brocadiia bacterium]